MVPILLSLVISVVANLLYAYADAFPENIAQYILIVSRALVGFGAGKFDRTLSLAWLLYSECHIMERNDSHFYDYSSFKIIRDKISLQLVRPNDMQSTNILSVCMLYHYSKDIQCF